MAYSGGNFMSEGGSGNVWSSGSRGGSRGGHSRSSNDDDNGSRGGGSYRGSFGNNNSRRGGSYGFQRRNDGDVEILKDAIFIQNLPKNITRDEILDAFSTVGSIKTDERSGGPKIWIYKDRDTGEGNGRATVTYEDEETADKAVATYNDQHIDSIDAVVHVQHAQRRNRNNDNGGRGYRGGRSNWDNNNSRQGFGSSGGHWNSSGGGFSDQRSGGFRNRGGDNDSFRDNDDRGGSYRGNRGGGSYRGNRDGPYRGASHGNSGSSNYSPY